MFSMDEQQQWATCLLAVSKQNSQSQKLLQKESENCYNEFSLHIKQHRLWHIHYDPFGWVIFNHAYKQIMNV